MAKRAGRRKRQRGAPPCSWLRLQHMGSQKQQQQWEADSSRARPVLVRKCRGETSRRASRSRPKQLQWTRKLAPQRRSPFAPAASSRLSWRRPPPCRCAAPGPQSARCPIPPAAPPSWVPAGPQWPLHLPPAWRGRWRGHSHGRSPAQQAREQAQQLNWKRVWRQGWQWRQLRQLRQRPAAPHMQAGPAANKGTGGPLVPRPCLTGCSCCCFCCRSAAVSAAMRASVCSAWSSRPTICSHDCTQQGGRRRV